MQKHNQRIRLISRLEGRYKSLDYGKIIFALDSSLDGKKLYSDAGALRRLT